MNNEYVHSKYKWIDLENALSFHYHLETTILKANSTLTLNEIANENDKDKLMIINYEDELSV